MEALYTTTLLLVLSTFSGAQLQSIVERSCPGESVTFTCTISSLAHQWSIPSLGIIQSLLPNDQGRVISNSPFQFNVTEVITGSYIISTATVNATADLNGTTVLCQDGIEMHQDQSSTIMIIGPPSDPTLACINLSGDVSGAVNVTVSWTLSGGDSADYYLMNITTNAPETPYEGVLNITNASVTQYELSGFMAGYEYSIGVRGVNCRSQEGTEREPLTITPQVPAVPGSCNITLSYNQSSESLLFINSTWDTVPDPGDLCLGLIGNITQYQISFQTGSVVATENVNIARCTAGRCSHTFEPPSNPPSSYDSVSVAAENVVGMGAARMCTTQTISTTNNFLSVEVIDHELTSPSDARINCIFISGFTGSAHCTVQYGDDPSYMNLSYSAESTETGTAGDTVSVVLRERLNSSTVYYYSVYAVSGDVSVIVQGTFTTPQYSCNLTQLWNLPAANATFQPDVSLLGNGAPQYPSCADRNVRNVVLRNTTLKTATVAYYNGTTAGSRACFVCDEGYELNTTTSERVCQGNGLWSGNPIVCECRLPPLTVALIVTGVLALVTIAVATTLAIIEGITDCCVQLNKLVRIGDCCSEKKKEEGMDKANRCWHFLVVAAIICWVFGVVFWITVAMVVSNPPNGNACDPSWRSTRDGLIAIAFTVSIVAFILGAATIWTHIYYHKNRITKKTFLKVLLGIAFIFTIAGVGVWIASVVLLYIHNPLPCRQDATDEEGQTQKDESGQNLELQDTNVQRLPNS